MGYLYLFHCYDKNLRFRRRTARRVASVEILPTVAQRCRYNSSQWTRRRCNPQARPSTSFVDYTIDLRWRNYLSSELGTNFQRVIRLFFEVTRISLQHSLWSKEAPTYQKPALSVYCRFDAIPACDGQTKRKTDIQTHDDNLYRRRFTSVSSECFYVDAGNTVHTTHHAG